MTNSEIRVGPATVQFKEPNALIQFDSFTAFIDMGGHGPYVWSVYGVALSLMIWLVVRPLRRKRALLLQIERQQRREQAANVVGGEV